MRKTKKQLEADLALARLEAQSWKDAHAALIKALTQCGPQPFYVPYVVTQPVAQPLPLNPYINPYPIVIPSIWCADGNPPMTSTITVSSNCSDAVAPFTYTAAQS